MATVLPSLESETEVTIACPRLENLLYDAPVDSFRVFLFDEHNQLVKAEDVFPEPVSLKAGDYTLKAEVRSTDVDQLEDYKQLGMELRYDLSSPVSVIIDRTRAGAARRPRRRRRRAAPFRRRRTTSSQPW